MPVCSYAVAAIQFPRDLETSNGEIDQLLQASRCLGEAADSLGHPYGMLLSGVAERQGESKPSATDLAGGALLLLPGRQPFGVVLQETNMILAHLESKQEPTALLRVLKLRARPIEGLDFEQERRANQPQLARHGSTRSPPSRTVAACALPCGPNS